MLGYSWWQIGHAALGAVLRLVCNPLLYISLLLMVVEMRRAVRAERRFFGVRVTRPWRSLLTRWLEGLAAGLVMSIVCIACGVVVRPWDLWLVSAISLILGIVRLRMAATVYSIGLVAFASAALHFLQSHGVAPASTWGVAGSAWEHLLEVPADGWLALAAAGLLMESVLLFLHRKGPASPAVVMGKRGLNIGAFIAYTSFVAPLFALSPGTLQPPSFAVSNWPWFGTASGGLALIGIPFVMGCSGSFTTVKTHVAMNTAVIYAAIAAFCAAGAAAACHWWNPEWAMAGGAALWLCKELAAAVARRREARWEPIYTETPEGVRILTVLEGSLAEAMGLRPGEVITHVNQVPVHTPYDLHFAFEQNPAYAKLQVLDERGVPRIVGKPVYSGERVKLGLILAPVGQNGPSYQSGQQGLFQMLYLRLHHPRAGGEETRVEPVAPNAGS